MSRSLRSFRVPSDDDYHRLAKDSARNREELAALEQRIQKIRTKLGQIDATKQHRKHQPTVLR